MTLKKKIHIALLAILISLPYIHLIHGHFTHKFDDKEVVLAQGTIVSKNIEHYLGGKSSSGRNAYIMVVNDNGINKPINVNRDVYYNNDVGNQISLVTTVTYIDEHNWFFFYSFIAIFLFIFGCCFLLFNLGRKYVQWVNT